MRNTPGVVGVDSLSLLEGKPGKPSVLMIPTSLPLVEDFYRLVKENEEALV